MKNTRLYKYFRDLERDIRNGIKRFFLSRKFRVAPPVFIYQMGKVASTSIYHSLRDQYPGAVGHAHHIGGTNWESKALYDWYSRGNELRIISPVRDPLSRNISSYFQQYSDCSEKEFEKLSLNTDDLIDDFIRQYDHDYPLRWFDDNIKRYFDIDVYEKSFPESGVAIYTAGNARLLVFRIDLEDPLKEKAIRDFIGFQPFHLENVNVSTDKVYYQQYRNFMKTIKLPESYLAKMRDSKFFRHFYKEDEIEAIISKWSR